MNSKNQLKKPNNLFNNNIKSKIHFFINKINNKEKGINSFQTKISLKKK